MASITDVAMRRTRNLTSGRFSEMHGLVTSYDPNTYLAKVIYQPEGMLSGWLPIETGHIGQGYGWVVGLQVGNGDSTVGSAGGAGSIGAGSQQQGDQVIVRFQEGDPESGKIVQRVHSQQDTPPPVQSGEMIAWTKFKQDQSPGPDAAQTGQQGSTGQKIWWKNDGSISTEDGNGASRVMDGKGNYTVSSGNAQQGTTAIVHQVLSDKPASNSNSGAGSVGSLLAGGNIGSILGSVLGGGSSTPGTMSGSTGGIGGALSGIISSLTGSGGGSGGSNGIIGLLSGLLGGTGLSGLTSALQQQIQNVVHYHKLDRNKGIKTSAFQEQHYTTWDQSGVTHSSQQNVTSIAQQNVQMQGGQTVTSTAPNIPHNGNTQVSQVLTVGQVTNSPIYTNASDIRLKHNIKPLGSTIAEIMAMEVMEFDEDRIVFDEHGKQHADPSRKFHTIGFLAQNLRKTSPDMVFGDEAKEFLSVSENKIGVKLLKAFQELHMEIAELKAQLNAKA